jgi:hypothetical protein
MIDDRFIQRIGHYRGHIETYVGKNPQTNKILNEERKNDGSVQA